MRAAAGGCARRWRCPAFAGDPAPRLEGDTTADVVILGGGYTGLWTAWFAKQLDPGADVVVLEQDICGGGPSGRNGGFVNSFWQSLPHLVERGTATRDAVRLCEEGEASVRAIGAFCEEQGFDAWYPRRRRADGRHRARRTSARGPTRCITLDRLGLSAHMQVLTPDEIRARIDSPVIRGGVFLPDGATVHPARLARGLRTAVMAAGVRVFEETPVTRFGVGPTVVAETPGGTVRAGAGVLAMNAWAQHWKAFRRVDHGARLLHRDDGAGARQARRRSGGPTA